MTLAGPGTSPQHLAEALRNPASQASAGGAAGSGPDPISGPGR